MLGRKLDKAFAIPVIALLLLAGGGEAGAQGLSFSDMSCGIADGRTPEQCKARIDAKAGLRKAQANAKQVADERIAALPAVKRIYSCDEKPATEAIVKGIDAVRKFTPDYYCSSTCPFDEVQVYDIDQPDKCGLRNSLAYTPAEIKASYPEGLLGQYVKALHDVRAASPDMRSFNEAARPVLDRLKEYILVAQCGKAEIQIADTVFKKTFDACNEPYYALARSATNVEQHLFKPQAEAEELKNGDFIVADYTELRYNQPHMRLYRIDSAALTVAPVQGEQIDSFTNTLQPETTFSGPLNFDRETGKLAMGGGNPHIGVFWSAEYQLEGDRLVLQSLRGMGEKGVKTFYSKADGIDEKALGPVNKTSTYYTRDLRRRDREQARQYEGTKPPLTEEEKAAYRAALEKMAAQPVPK